jgi:hypothetical protein
MLSICAEILVQQRGLDSAADGGRWTCPGLLDLQLLVTCHFFVCLVLFSGCY